MSVDISCMQLEFVLVYVVAQPATSPGGLWAPLCLLGILPIPTRVGRIVMEGQERLSSRSLWPILR